MDKFPLTLHATGQYCKKIHGKIYYFGKDRQAALKLYYQQASALHGKNGQSIPLEGTLTLQDLCNRFLGHQITRANANEIKFLQYEDQRVRLRHFATAIGPNKLVSEIKTFDLLEYRRKRIEAGRAPTTINNELAAIKAMFHWAEQSEVLDRIPRLDAVKKIPRKKVHRQTFTREEVIKLLDAASVQMKAMILLGMNCEFGCTDVAELRWEHLDLEARRVHYPRPKTGVDRNFILWPETVKALQAVQVKGELVFYTQFGRPWGWRSNGKYNEKPLTRAFTKLMKKAGIAAEKGTGFYTLRRTAVTIAAETGDAFAVQGVLGHADLTVASTYVQRNRLTPQTDKAIEHTRQWLIAEPKAPDDSE